MSPLTLFLYTTAGCHLCEQAEQIISETLNPEFFEIIKVDIADDDLLIEKYGVRIPVIGREDSGEELGWPFDHHGLVAFLSD